MANLNLDPIHDDPLFQLTDHRVVIHAANQVVTLPRAVHATSLVVEKQSGESWVGLVETTDYTLNNDSDALSKALLSDPDFSGQLVSGFTMVGGPAGAELWTLRITAVTLEVDPYGVAGILDHVVSDTVAAIRCLEPDYSGLREDNFIHTEEHYVSTAVGKQIILPACGPFYLHDLTLTVKSTGTVLTLGTDYIVAGLDTQRTKDTVHSSAVYRAIYLNLAITGVVQVDYRAFGGEFTRHDGEYTRAAIETILRYLGASQRNLNNAVINAPVVTDLVSRLRELELQLSLIWDGGFSGVRHLRIITVLDEEYHWINIGHLYRTPEGLRVNQGHSTFRVIGLTNLNLDCWFTVSFNSDLPHEQLLLSRLAAQNSVTVDPVSLEYGELGAQLIPRVRAIWGSDTGAVLQFALPIRGLAPGSMAEIMVEAHNTTTNPWQLLAEPTSVHGDHDTNVPLPDGSLWTSAGGSQRVRTLDYQNGVILWTGSLPLDNQPGWRIAHGVPYSEELYTTDLSKLVATFYDRYTDSFFDAEGGVLPRGGDLTAADYTYHTTLLFYPLDLCGLELRILGAMGKRIQIQWRATPGSHSLGEGMAYPVERFELVRVAGRF